MQSAVAAKAVVASSVANFSMKRYNQLRLYEICGHYGVGVHVCVSGYQILGREGPHYRCFYRAKNQPIRRFSVIAGSGRKPYGIDLSRTVVELSRKQVPQGTFKQCNMLNCTAAPVTFC